jgi:alginate O-acetyltransferase complex protein AlgI
MPGGWRKYFLFALSLFFIAVASIPWAVYFLLNVVLAYLAGSLITKNGKNKKLIITSALIWFVGSICYFKYANAIVGFFSFNGMKFSVFQQFPLSRIFLPIGMSYIIFRLIHYLVELYRNNTPRGSFIDLALYVFFFPTFLAGPVDRFQRFYPQVQERKDFAVSECNYGLFRIVCGLVKKFIIADRLAVIIMPVLHTPYSYSRPVVMFMVYGLAIQIYLDFSGYTDIAVGLARLFGYKIMENFNHPFFQKNIALFWRNWHISVYSWIRDYFFFPIFGSRASIFKLYCGIFLSMIVFHLWHAATIGFLILGIYHGIGLIIWQFFQELKKKNPLLRKVVSYKWLNPVSVFITFNFVSFGFIFFNFSGFDPIVILRTILTRR